LSLFGLVTQSPTAAESVLEPLALSAAMTIPITTTARTTSATILRPRFFWGGGGVNAAPGCGGTVPYCWDSDIFFPLERLYLPFFDAESGATVHQLTIGVRAETENAARLRSR
jgi:hypothetical protein